MTRILIIDDEPAIRGLMKLALASEGHEVALAENGDEGFGRIAREQFDLVIVDLYMPGKEGIETISHIRKLFSTLPIIAMSGTGLADEMLSVARLLGVKAALKKPFTTQELANAVKNALKSV